MVQDNLQDELDGEEQEPAAQAPKATPNRRKKLLIAGGIALLLLLAGAALYLFAFRSTGDSVTTDSDAVKLEELLPEGFDDEDELEEDEEALGAILPLETFIVNLAGEGRFLRCQIQLEFNTRDVPQRFYQYSIPVRHALIGMLSSRRAEEVVSSQGREQLRQDIRDLVNAVLRREWVRNVYFTQFVVQ